MNRDRTARELERRYQEAIYSTRQDIVTPLQYEQMLTVIAHFMQYMNEDSILRRAVKRLTGEKKYAKADEEITAQANELIKRLNVDSNKLRRIAKRKSIPIEVAANASGRIPDNQRFALTLRSVNIFLQQEERDINSIPEHLGNLRVMVWALRKQGVGDRTLKAFSDPYTPLQNEFAQKLRLNKLYENYLRLNDYKALEDVRRFIYQEMTDQMEQIVFLSVDNDDLIDYSHTKQYDKDELESAKLRQIEYYGNILRFHNYIVDELEDIPFYLKFSRWMFANFGSTLVSVLLIVGVYFVAIWLGAPIDPEKLTTWLLK